MSMEDWSRRYRRNNSYGKVVKEAEPVIRITKTKYGYAISRNGNVGGITDTQLCHDLGFAIMNQYHMALEQFGGKPFMDAVMFETEGQAMNALMWIRSMQVEAREKNGTK